MLSPGTYHKKVPRDLRLNLKYRRGMIEECRKDRGLQQAAIHMCREDILFYINAFVWQFNPTRKGIEAVGPFLTWDFQEAALLDRPELTGKKGLLWCYENNRSAVVSKSREMGATWLFLIFQDWLSIFQPYTQVLNISKSADAVDDKSRDSLFAKIRFMHDHLPNWLKGPIEHRKMFISYERTKSEITGEASTGRAGVSGRASLIFIDEFSKIKEDREVRERTASTAGCRFFNSTHEGMATEFYKLTQTPEFIQLQFHWSQHPDKKKGLYRFNKETNRVDILDKTYHFPHDYPFDLTGNPVGGPYPGLRSPWYDSKCAEIGSKRGIAVELDINVSGSVQQFFDEQIIRDLIARYAVEPWWEGELHFEPLTGKPIALRQAKGGHLKLWVNLGPNDLPPAGHYAIGGDISTGSGATPSVLCCGNCQTGEKVWEYANPHIEPDKLAGLASALGWLFADPVGYPARLAWEIPGPGATFGKHVMDLAYPNVFYMPLDHVLDTGRSKESPGWYANNESKPFLLRELSMAYTSRQFCDRSRFSLEECLAFKYDSKGNVVHTGEQSEDDPSGARVNHGDRVIASGLVWMLIKQSGRMAGTKKAEERHEPPVQSLLWRRQKYEERRKALNAW